jgi:hypothetical protein
VYEDCQFITVHISHNDMVTGVKCVISKMLICEWTVVGLSEKNHKLMNAYHIILVLLSNFG